MKLPNNKEKLCSMASIALLVGLTALVVLVPDTALAADVNEAFKKPLVRILELLSGTIAGALVGLAVAVAGVTYIISREDPSGWVMKLVSVAIGGVIIYFGSMIGAWLMS